MAYPIPLILHIGYPRTGTTLLQSSLELDNPHILYLGRNASASSNERWFSQKIKTYWDWLRFHKEDIDVSRANEFINDILITADKKGFYAAVISDETICKPETYNYYEGLAERLKLIFPSAKILLTLRNQANLIFSMYGRALSGALSKNTPIDYFHKWFLCGAGSAYSPVDIRFNFTLLYKELVSRFDADDVNVLLYEQLKDNPEAFISSLKKIFGVNTLNIDTNYQVNTSPKFDTGNELMRHILSKDFGLYNMKGIRHFPNIIDFYYFNILRINFDQSLYRMSPDDIRFMDQLFYKSNDRLAELTGIDLASFGYATLENMNKKYYYYNTSLPYSSQI